MIMKGISYLSDIENVDIFNQIEELYSLTHESVNLLLFRLHFLTLIYILRDSDDSLKYHDLFLFPAKML